MPTDPMDLDAFRDSLAAWLLGRRKVVQEELAATIQMSLERLEPDEALLAQLAKAIPAPGAASAEGEAALGKALDAMSGATSQVECLQRLLDGLALLSPRSAVFVVKQGILNLYAWRGFATESPKSGTPVMPPPELLDLVMGHSEGLDTPGPGYQALLAALSLQRAPALRVLPLRLKRRTVAVVLVDSGSHSGLAHPQLLRALVQCGAAALGNLGTAAAPDERISITQQLPVMSATGPIPLPQAPAQTEAPIPMSAPHLPPPPMPVSPSATTGPVSMSALRPAPAPAPLPPRPLPPPVAAPPPMEATNPGLTAAPAPGLDPKTRAAAERLARVLAGDVELYFPAKVAQARTTGNLYGLLRDELDRSRHTFVDRFGAELETTHGIFRETVISLLCDGNAAKLGSPPWK